MQWTHSTHASIDQLPTGEISFFHQGETEIARFNMDRANCTPASVGRTTSANGTQIGYDARE
jgi:hypothetical protein